MKKAEDALTEWTSDEIAFNFGVGNKRFTRDQFSYVCSFLKDSTITPGCNIQVVSANGEQWLVPIKTFVHENLLDDTRRAISRNGKTKDIHPRVAMQYHDLGEILAWAKGELTSDFKIPTPMKVEPWMRPLP